MVIEELKEHVVRGDKLEMTQLKMIEVLASLH